jgi:Uma2 family endonuclease
MPNPTKRNKMADALRSIPKDMTGEIIDGELIVIPEPTWKKVLAETVVKDMLAPYHLSGSAGPGGWTILVGPKIVLGNNVICPDLAGWNKERFPGEVESDLISVVPDWVCEILSQETARLDKPQKMPIYAQFGVSHLWLIDPTTKALGLVSVYQLDPESAHWLWLGGFFENDKINAPPFLETEIEFSQPFRKLAFVERRLSRAEKDDIVSKLRTLLESSLADIEPTEPEDT